MGTWYFEKRPDRAYEGNWRPGDPSRYLEVAVVVGARIRRLRLDRDVKLKDLAAQVRKPGGGHYTASHFSRLERGWANATLYEPSPGELVLLRYLRRAGIAPEEALQRIVSP